MKLSVKWSYVCEADVRRMPWEAAARVCRAILVLAEGQPTELERVSGADPFLVRVRARGGEALLRIDTGTCTLYVWRIYATRR